MQNKEYKITYICTYLYSLDNLYFFYILYILYSSYAFGCEVLWDKHSPNIIKILSTHHQNHTKARMSAIAWCVAWCVALVLLRTRV